MSNLPQSKTLRHETQRPAHTIQSLTANLGAEERVGPLARLRLALQAR
jgi:hypothetical protein